jgi:hypothetical protein
MSIKDQIINLAQAKPHLTRSALANEIGCAYKTVTKALDGTGITPPSPRSTAKKRVHKPMRDTYLLFEHYHWQCLTVNEWIKAVRNEQAEYAD